ncbi:ArnT family glycosyltransferase [Tundrisphaera lichenicola]|uniref:ArnT family glycosyltransferase n=1 Tax=Tundrisphaera lichenicola TaxID=2029860 RepID=UPI003EBBF64B
MTPRRTLWGLIVATGLIRLAWAASLGPGTDEAYHYLFTVHRDWSYFDHPPMLAVVESLGLLVTGGYPSTFALRLGFVGLFAGSTWLMARLTSRLFGPWAGVCAAIALNVSAYHTAAASTFALPDGPLLFFWLLTLDRLAIAFEEPDRLRNWAAIGLAWGGAMLSKYHAVFLPTGAFLYILAEPSARRVLRKPGPYLAMAIGLAAFSPVIAWNATHEWASFAFQGERAMARNQLRLDTLVSAIGGQAAYLFPWIWLSLVVLLARYLARFRRDASPAERFLICQSVAPLAAFTAVACLRPVLPHWTLVGYLSLFPLLGRAWEARYRLDPSKMGRRLAIAGAVPLLIAVFMVAEYRTGMLQKAGLTAKVDPTVDMYGWDQVAAELDRRGMLDDPGSFLFTRNWISSGQLAFATRASGVPVLCYNHKDARSFAFWSRPEDWVGHDGILVSFSEIAYEPACYERFFERIEPAGSFEIARAGGPIRKVRLFRCTRQLVAFPFLPGEPDPSRARVALDRPDDDSILH